MNNNLIISKKTKDISGKKFGDWTVVKFEYNQNGKSYWSCVCSCGKKKIVTGVNLTSGKTKSCGCTRKEINKRNFQTHGARANKNAERLYGIWRNMKSRCSNEKDTAYNRYGGRGVKVCEDWKNSYEAFRDWSFQNGYREDLTIDRIDNNGNYEPSNCRWATLKEQARNKRTNLFLEYNGEKYILTDLAKILQVDRGTIKYHIFQKGRCIEEMLEIINKKTSDVQ